uniref:cancer-related nucleoside-triphosphatase-like n=1 Tax=Styela clava TaxID=7725 RepID=UPI00193A3D8F|nr:cancer-related nucleoside-triphosphatase-like [Styela clava]
MQSSGRCHIFLTGLPGVGKTTLIEKAIANIKESGISISGFYTKERRNGNERIGFDIVTLCGKQAPLARCSVSRKGPMVGKYTVDVASFEDCVLPLLEETSDSKHLYIIDEVGKMELFSERFKRKTRKILQDSDNEFIVLGTIPVKRGKGIPFVESIREDKRVKIFEVTKHNRNDILNDIVQSILVQF